MASGWEIDEPPAAVKAARAASKPARPWSWEASSHVTLWLEAKPFHLTRYSRKLPTPRAPRTASGTWAASEARRSAAADCEARSTLESSEPPEPGADSARCDLRPKAEKDDERRTSHWGVVAGGGWAEKEVESDVENDAESDAVSHIFHFRMSS